jgi:hypothetical protein
VLRLLTTLWLRLVGVVEEVLLAVVVLEDFVPEQR